MLREADSRRDESGSALVITLLVTLLLFVLGAALLGTSEIESAIAANDQSSEGAFQAAEAAVHVAVDQMDVNTTDQVVSPTDLGAGYVFRSGGRDDATPQPPQRVGSRPGEGFAVAASTGYNAAGYAFEIYQVNGTGTGPRSTEREVEVQVELGPVAQ